MPDEHLMFFALLEIDFGNELVRVGTIRESVLILSTWIRRNRKEGRQLQTSRKEQARTDLVIGERREQRYLASGVASRRSGHRKVAISHVGRRQQYRRCLRIGPFGSELVSHEPEQFVLDDRTTQRSADLIAFQTVVADRTKGISRIEDRVSHVPERIAMNAVGSGPRDDID